MQLQWKNHIVLQCPPCILNFIIMPVHQRTQREDPIVQPEIWKWTSPSRSISLHCGWFKSGMFAVPDELNKYTLQKWDGGGKGNTELTKLILGSIFILIDTRDLSKFGSVNYFSRSQAILESVFSKLILTTYPFCLKVSIRFLWDTIMIFMDYFGLILNICFEHWYTTSDYVSTCIVK